jgi:hypothetical protein
MTILKDDALDRWMYKRNGMDYGPFTTRELEHIIERREITAETEVQNRRTRQWLRVQDVPKLYAYIQERTQREEQAAREAEIEKDHDTVHRGNWWTTKMPLIAGAVLAIVGGIAAILVLRPPPPVLAGYPTRFYRELQFERIVPLRAMIAEPVKVSAVPPRAKRAKVARTTTSTSATPGIIDMAPQVDISFDTEDTSGGRQLTQADLDDVQRTVAPRLIRCFRLEAGRNPAFEGGSVFVYILPRGTAQVSRISTNPGPGPELTACARATTNGINVGQFAGAAQVMEIPLHVAASAE